MKFGLVSHNPWDPCMVYLHLVELYGKSRHIYHSSQQNLPRPQSGPFGGACDRLFLHCSKLRLYDLHGHFFSVTAPLPPELQDFLQLLRKKKKNHMTLGTGGFPGIHMVGWCGGGVGWGMITFFALAHMVGATQHHGMGWAGVGWGMITFLALAHMADATQHHLSCTCTHGRCYATSWDGVGDDNVPCTCTHGRCYATSWDGVGWGGVGDDNVPCTCTHGRCYATSSFLYLHTWSVLRNIMGWGGVGDDNVPCTCTHGRCYATSTFLYLHTWSLLRNIMGWGGVGDDNVPCTCTHGRCYATSTFLYLHTWSVLRNIMGWGGVGWGGGWSL